MSLKSISKNDRFEIFVDGNGDLIFSGVDASSTHCANCGYPVRPFSIRDHYDECRARNINNECDREAIKKRVGLTVGQIKDKLK